MSRCPYFQFFPADFLVGSAAMTCEGRGAYIALLCHAWESDGVPDDPRVLGALTGATEAAINEARAKFYKDDDGKLRNKRMEETRCKLKDYREGQAKKARKAWDKRKKQATSKPQASHKLAGGETMPYQSQSQSQSQTPKPNTKNQNPSNGVLTRETTARDGLPSPWEISQALQAVSSSLEENRNRHRAEVAGGSFHWDNPEARALDVSLVKRKRELNNALAGI